VPALETMPRQPVAPQSERMPPAVQRSVARQEERPIRALKLPALETAELEWERGMAAAAAAL
jgi:hypothetical protein